MTKAPKQQARYSEAVRRALNGGPQPEGTLAEAVLKAVGSKQCVEVRRLYARLAAAQRGRPKGWKAKNITAKEEAALGASIFVRRTMRALIQQGRAKKTVGKDGQRTYSLAAGKAPRKKKEA